MLALLLKWMFIRTKMPVAQRAVTMVATSARIERISRMGVSGWRRKGGILGANVKLSGDLPLGVRSSVRLAIALVDWHTIYFD